MYYVPKCGGPHWRTSGQHSLSILLLVRQEELARYWNKPSPAVKLLPGRKLWTKQQYARTHSHTQSKKDTEVALRKQLPFSQRHHCTKRPFRSSHFCHSRELELFFFISGRYNRHLCCRVRFPLSSKIMLPDNMQGFGCVSAALTSGYSFDRCRQ